MFESLTQFLEDQESRVIQGDVQFRDGSIGTSSFFQVIAEVTSTLDIAPKQPRHKKSVIAYILAQFSLSLDSRQFVSVEAGLESIISTTLVSRRPSRPRSLSHLAEWLKSASTLATYSAICWSPIPS